MERVQKKLEEAAKDRVIGRVGCVPMLHWEIIVIGVVAKADELSTLGSPSGIH